MCLADFKNISIDIQKEIDRLLNSGLISLEEAKLLNKKSIENFVNSNLYKRILNSPKVLREHRFSVRMPVSEARFSGNISKEKSSESLVVVQGAMDCAFIEDGLFVIVDYKTDKSNDVKNLYEKYVSQLEIYKYALETTQDIKVKEIGIYSFYLSSYYF